MDVEKIGRIQTVIDYDYGKKLNECRLHLPVHIKMDTGMHRLGIDSRIAILPIGHGDGLPGNLFWGKGSVLIHGKRVPI